MASQALETRLNAHLNSGSMRAAALFLTGEADRGDPGALYHLATWRVSGSIVRRDLGAARDLLRRAAEGGHEEAAALYMTFLANGTGGTPDWREARRLLEHRSETDTVAAAQLALIAAMDIDDVGNPAQGISRHQLSAAPDIRVSEGLLTAAECDYLRNYAEPRLQPSLVFDPSSGQLIPHPIRRSDGMAFGVFDENPFVAAINRRIAAVSETDVFQGEPLQILRYRPGGEYRAHLDALPGVDNQRIITVLIYLANDYTGGETQFTGGFTFRGRKGDALLFRNVVNGRPDQASQHAGLPVRSGEKVIASRWIRERAFTFPPPVPALPDLG